MTSPDHSFLAEANARRHQAALAAAHDAIERLDRDGHTVSFGAVAHAAGVSRAWLYRQAELRQIIERLRKAPPPTTAQSTRRAGTDSLRQRLDTAKVEIARLRADNSALRDQLAHHLGAQRARHDNQQPTGS
jgi:hypothetical protein